MSDEVLTDSGQDQQPTDEVPPVPTAEELVEPSASDSSVPAPGPAADDSSVTKAGEAAVPAPPQQPDIQSAQEIAEGAEPTPAVAPTPVLDVTGRVGGDVNEDKTDQLSWSARSDVGLVRSHNEDAFLVRAPLFAVCDGMGGHAAGEVASSIAVHTIAEQTPISGVTDTDLGAAIESANAAIIEGADAGVGKPGMGCTASAVMIDKNHIIIGHVGDSRVYLLNQGKLVRITHDHSFVEELVDAGEITADEARVHPSRSIITRALGNDPDMYADHFTLEITKGDRIIICSDGLSSMITDSHIEDIACTTPTPKQCTDRLVGAALAAGGHDNVTVVTIDILDDGLEEERRRAHRAKVMRWVGVIMGILLASGLLGYLFVSNAWYVGDNLGTVAIYRGIPGRLMGMRLSHIDETTSVETSDLPESTQKLLQEGIPAASSEAAREIVEAYRDQIEEEKTKALETADNAQQAPQEDETSAADANSSNDSETGAAEQNTAEPSAATSGAPETSQAKPAHSTTTQSPRPIKGVSGR
ncbi:MAG: Stp1/IreP family PP2C-type Ser/Thr phosphatase [Atopobiaceae bacterium]|nr:Stp1/IreP family PP2C-type Ser/Thr phosphatase [Atopobiaceae bacterium]